MHCIQLSAHFKWLRIGEISFDRAMELNTWVCISDNLITSKYLLSTHIIPTSLYRLRLLNSIKTSDLFLRQTKKDQQLIWQTIINKRLIRLLSRMNKPNMEKQIIKIQQQLEELEKSQMFVMQALPYCEDYNNGYTTPKSKKSSNSNYGSEYPSTPSQGEYSNGFQQTIFNAPSKEYEFPEHMYESPKNTTSLKFKFMNNTYTYLDNEEIEQQKHKKDTSSNSYYHNYLLKKEQDQNDLRVILGLPIFEKED